MDSSDRKSRLLQLTELHPALWRANQMGSSTGEAVRSGFSDLDKQLPGDGWPARTMIELLLKHHGIGELRLLIPALRKLGLSQRWIVFVHPPFMPVPNVLEQFGIPHEQLILIQADKPQDRLWTVEQLIKSRSFGALLVWLPEQKRLVDQATLRRLQHLACNSGGLSFFFRPLQAQNQPSPAPLRLCLTAHSNEELLVQIIKRRGPVMDNRILITLPRPLSALPGEFELPPVATFDHEPQEQLDDAMDRTVVQNRSTRPML